jgi:putative oxidoreductase
MTEMTDTPARAPYRSRSFTANIVSGFVALCRRLVPYALVALILRLVIARVFFLSGQSKITGQTVPISMNLPGLDLTSLGEWTIVLPAEIKPSTFQLFETEYAALPMSSTVAAYLFTYAEFVLPVCLVLGFATRFAALGLIAMTVLMQIYVVPGMWWAAHVYWIAILLVLVSVGPGALSIDALLRWIYARE